jgi:hypothetical protein
VSQLRSRPNPDAAACAGTRAQVLPSTGIDGRSIIGSVLCDYWRSCVANCFGVASLSMPNGLATYLHGYRHRPARVRCPAHTLEAPEPQRLADNWRAPSQAIKRRVVSKRSLLSFRQYLAFRTDPGMLKGCRLEHLLTRPQACP